LRTDQQDTNAICPPKVQNNSSPELLENSVKDHFSVTANTALRAMEVKSIKVPMK